MQNLIYEQLAQKDPAMQSLLDRYGLPPVWKRPNTFASLVRIILEQQVSLAAAYSAFTKLEAKLGIIQPSSVLRLDSLQMRACFISRQKTSYIHNLAREITEHGLDLSKLEQLPDNRVKESLIHIKGIGDWTANLYLLIVLNRPDIFPASDIALQNSMKYELSLDKLDQDSALEIAQRWRPYRSYATYLFYWAYINRKKVSTLLD